MVFQEFLFAWGSVKGRKTLFVSNYRDSFPSQKVTSDEKLKDEGVKFCERVWAGSRFYFF